ncbi:MAG: methionine--tRNA ligase [Acidimicrobiales bacterium]
MTRYLVTSALPYINGVKHLGNLVGSMLPADAYSRYLRSANEEVLFICATDEHGTPAELAARAAGLDVAEFCRVNHEVQRDLGERFGLSFDHFGRTSNIANHELTQHFAERLDAEGFIEERVIRQIYSNADGRFLPDRYVEGTCPNCGYERARGDQCEHCTKQLDPTMLIDPRSAISGSTDLEERESRHLYLLQSRLAERLRPWIESKVGIWPTLATSIGLKWLDEGLEDRGITRDLDWGIPVNRPGFEGKVFYVWFDAPIGYISATREWAEAGPAAGEPDRDWESWWRNDRGAEDVIYTEFMAKDNVPFHTLGFPATLMGSGEPWRLVDHLKSFNWLNYYGGKFSTSDHRGVFMSDALELLPADYWRWYLLSNAPESDDTSFSWELFAESVNKELVGTLGNFVNRCATQISRHFDDRVPAGGEPGDEETALVHRLTALVAEYDTHMRALEFRKSAQALRSIWAEGNVYLEAREPWRAIKTDRDAAAVTLRTALGLARLFGRLSSPFIPATADRLGELVPGAPSLDGMAASLAGTILDVEPGLAFVAPGLLFQKIDDDTTAAWIERFGGPE